MAIALSVQRLQKSYAGRELFREISFGLEDGERVGLLGPNGAGKSTLLKILAKNERPDSGDVVYRKGLRVAYLAQSPQFQPEDSIQSLLLNNYDMDSEQLSRAFEWIGKVGLSDLNFESPILELSGGWQKRVSLAQELMKNPDLLLLDEPTNHLDVLGIKWLEEFLQDAKLTCLMVTHDRLFLQRTCLRILDLDPQFPGQILSVPGTYSKYIETKTNMRAEQMVRETKLSNTLRREMEWLARGAKARQTKQQARQQSAADLGQEVGRLNNLNRDRSLQMSFGANEKGPQKLIQAQNLGQELGGRSLFKNLDMVVTVKTRVGLLGPNGAGKSTLIKTLLGILPPVEGRALMAEKLSVNYFEQNRDTLNPELSVRKNLCPEGDYVDFRGTFVHVRSYLDKFRFFKDRADLPVHRLSGGEQARLRIAQLMLKESKILVLDEPTNDLDLETLQILQQALEEFPGAVILVSHDRYFMDQVCSEILAFHPGTDQLIMFADYLQWEEWYDKNPPLQATAKSNEAAATSASAHEKTTPEKPKEKPKSKPLTFTEKFDLEKMEEKSKGLEQDVHRAQEKLAALSSQPVTAELGQKIAKATQELASAQEKLEQLLERWADLDQRSKI